MNWVSIEAIQLEEYNICKMLLLSVQSDVLISIEGRETL